MKTFGNLSCELHGEHPRKREQSPPIPQHVTSLHDGCEYERVCVSVRVCMREVGRKREEDVYL